MKYQAVIRLAICVILTAGLIGTVLCFALDSRDKALLNRQSDALTPQSEAETTKGEQWQEPSAPMFLGEKAEKYSLADPTNDRFTDTDLLYEQGDAADRERVQIYDRMLRAPICYYSADVTFETNMITGRNTVVHDSTVVPISGDEAIAAYEKITGSDGQVQETFVSGTQITSVDHAAKEIRQSRSGVFTQNTAILYSPNDRIHVDEKGQPHYTFMANITNCPSAPYVLFPQGLVYSFLKDFDRWEITEHDKYLDRECARIEGTVTPWIAEKHGIDSFVMVVDYDTGVVLGFSGNLNGATKKYIRVTDCILQGYQIENGKHWYKDSAWSTVHAEDIQKFDAAAYPNYRIVTE